MEKIVSEAKYNDNNCLLQAKIQGPKLNIWPPEQSIETKCQIFQAFFHIFSGTIPIFRVFQGPFLVYQPSQEFFRAFRGCWPTSSSNKHGIQELPHKLPNDLKLRILGNWETSRSQNFIELQPSAQSSSQNENFVDTSKKMLENRNSTFPIVRYFTTTLKVVSYVLARIAVKRENLEPAESSFNLLVDFKKDNI